MIDAAINGSHAEPLIRSYVQNAKASIGISLKEREIEMPNPYDPQNPVKPTYFGGRRAMINSFKERLNGALTSKQPGGVLIYGHRGVGKTSLLKKFIDITTESNRLDIIIIYRRLSAPTSSESLYRILLEELNVRIRERQNLVQKMKELGKNIAGLNAFGVGIDIEKEQNSLSHFQVWKMALRSLKEASCIIIAIDEADELELNALGELKTMMEEVADLPILLVISGGVEFEERLVGVYSPIARIFSGASHNISRFDYTETKEVLELGVKNESTQWGDEAIKGLYNFTLGYPYLVQCLAKASYREGEKITAKAVSDSVENAVEMGKAWLSHEIPHASDVDILSFLKIIGLNKEVFQSQEIANQDISPPYVGRLIKLKVIKKVSYGRYKLEKSPIVAIFEKLKRGI